MKHYIYLLFLLLSSLVAMNCEKEAAMPTQNEAQEQEPASSEDCWNRTDQAIIFTQLTETNITLPSKISIYFKLDDKDGHPLANLTATNFNIYEQTADSSACLQAVSQFEAPRTIQGSQEDFTHGTLILLDLSGSVLNNLSTEVKDATKALVEAINPHPDTSLNKVGIWWFDGAAELHQLIAPTYNKQALLNKIDQISPDLSKDNSTNLYGAVTSIAEQASAVLQEERVSGVSILLFTDGKDRANRVSRQSAYMAIDESPAAVNFFSVGLGEEINETDLKKFGKDGFVGIQEVSQLSATFTNIAQSVKDESNSYYLLEYCSPNRSGTDNVLIIEAVADGKKGYLESPFSAVGFEGGCTL